MSSNNFARLTVTSAAPQLIVIERCANRPGSKGSAARLCLIVEICAPICARPKSRKPTADPPCAAPMFFHPLSTTAVKMPEPSKPFDEPNSAARCRVALPVCELQNEPDFKRRPLVAIDQLASPCFFDAVPSYALLGAAIPISGAASISDVAVRKFEP
jgi:hypothetical protein